VRVGDTYSVGSLRKTRIGIPVFVKILPEDGPYRPKHVVMIQV
jgi:hypothetical protein